MYKPAQIARFVLDTRNANEHAWHLIPTLRRALLAERAIDILRGADRETIPVANIEQLFAGMLEYANTLPGGVPL